MVDGTCDLITTGFNLIRFLISHGYVARPRYLDMRRFTKRLSHSPYKGLGPLLTLEKLTIHMDGFSSVPTVDFSRPFVREFKPLLKLLWRQISIILMVDPQWYHHIPTEPTVEKPLSVEERGIAANLRMNGALSANPELEGHFLYEVDDKDILVIHGVVKPPKEVLVFQNQALTNEWRRKNRYTLKLGPDCHAGSPKYLENQRVTDSYNEFMNGPMKHIRRLLIMRKEASLFRDPQEALNAYCREFIMAEENYRDSLDPNRSYQSVLWYLGVDRPESRPAFTPPTWRDPLRSKVDVEGPRHFYKPTEVGGNELLSELSASMDIHGSVPIGVAEVLSKGPLESTSVTGGLETERFNKMPLSWIRAVDLDPEFLSNEAEKFLTKNFNLAIAKDPSLDHSMVLWAIVRRTYGQYVERWDAGISTTRLFTEVVFTAQAILARWGDKRPIPPYIEELTIPKGI